MAQTTLKQPLGDLDAGAECPAKVQGKGKGKMVPPPPAQNSQSKAQMEEMKQKRAEQIRQHKAKLSQMKDTPDSAFVNPAPPARVANPLVEKILSCSEVASLRSLEQEVIAAQALKREQWEWPVWMVHRVFLNDPDLVTLDLRECNFKNTRLDANILPKLADTMAANTHVEQLLFSHAFLGFRDIVERLAASLQANTTLKVLVLDGCFMEPLKMVYLANAIAQNEGLVEVSFVTQYGSDELPGPVCQAFAAAAARSPTLRRLKLHWPEDGMAKEHIEKLLASKSTSIKAPYRTNSTNTKLEVNSIIDYSVAVNMVAQQTFRREDFLGCEPRKAVEIIPGRCWVVPGVFEADECDRLLMKWPSEFFRNTGPTSSLRTSRRRDKFVDVAMAKAVRERLPEDFIKVVESSGGPVRCVFEEWRVTKYGPEQFFRAHIDDAYFRVVANQCGEAGETSSHTVLVCLSDNYEGGATRFWPSGDYDVAIDVVTPKGSVLLFEQKGMLHEGRALESGTKSVAQTGLLRAPEGDWCGARPVQFQWGPGLQVSYGKAGA